MRKKVLLSLSACVRVCAQGGAISVIFSRLSRAVAYVRAKGRAVSLCLPSRPTAACRRGHSSTTTTCCSPKPTTIHHKRAHANHAAMPVGPTNPSAQRAAPQTSGAAAPSLEQPLARRQASVAVAMQQLARDLRASKDAQLS